MSNNKNLLGQLAAARERARSDAEVRTPKLPATPTSPAPQPVAAPVTSAPPASDAPAPKPKLAPERTRPRGRAAKAVEPAQAPKGQGTLERTTITLKPQDRAVLGRAQSFFIDRGIKAPTSSTLIRIALCNLGETLDAKPDNVQRIFERIRREDGRRAGST